MTMPELSVASLVVHVIPDAKDTRRKVIADLIGNALIDDRPDAPVFGQLINNKKKVLGKSGDNQRGRQEAAPKSIRSDREQVYPYIANLHIRSQTLFHRCCESLPVVY